MPIVIQCLVLFLGHSFIMIQVEDLVQLVQYFISTLAVIRFKLVLVGIIDFTGEDLTIRDGEIGMQFNFFSALLVRLFLRVVEIEQMQTQIMLI